MRFRDIILSRLKEKIKLQGRIPRIFFLLEFNLSIRGKDVARSIWLDELSTRELGRKLDLNWSRLELSDLGDPRSLTWLSFETLATEINRRSMLRVVSETILQTNSSLTFVEILTSDNEN